MPNILLIESDEGTRYLYRTAIKFQNIDVTESESLEDAIKKLTENKYDLVILDIMISDFEDVNIFEELRKAKDGIPIVIVSDLKNASTMKHASILGVCDYLVKDENSVGDIIKRVRSIVNVSEKK